MEDYATNPISEENKILVSNEQGSYEAIGLSKGLYKIVETKAPDGYERAGRTFLAQIIEEGQLDPNNIDPNKTDLKVKYYEMQANTLIKDPKDFKYIRVNNNEVILDNDNFISIQNNKLNAALLIDKVDDDHNPLEGAKFALFDTDGNQVGNEMTSGDDGKVRFENIPEGSYTLKETVTPDGYKESNKEWKIDVDINGVITVEEIKTDDTTANKKVQKASLTQRLFATFGLRRAPLDQGVQINQDVLNEVDNSYERKINPFENTFKSDDRGTEFDTKLVYDKDNKNFKVDLMVKSGPGKEKKEVVKTDIVVMIPNNYLGIENTRAFKSSVVNWLKELNNNQDYQKAYSIGFVTYGGSDVTSSMELQQLSENSIKAINDIGVSSSATNDTGIGKAFIKAKSILDAGSGTEKIIINQSTIRADSINKERADALKGLAGKPRVYNFPNNAWSDKDKIKTWYDNLFKDAGIDVTKEGCNKTTWDFESGETYADNFPKPKESSINIKDIENGKISVDIGDSFIPTYDSNWVYSNGVLTSKDNLSLGPETSKDYSFTLTPKNGVEKDQDLNLIDKITLKPRSDETTTYTIIDSTNTAKVKFYNKQGFTIKSSHASETIPEFASITGDIVRKKSNESDSAFTQIGSFNVDLRGEVTTPDLRVKSDDGKDYIYKLVNIKSSDENLIDIKNTEVKVQNNYAEISSENKLVDVTLKNVHTGEKSFEMSVTLHRRVNGKNDETVETYKLAKNASETIKLPEKDKDGNTYEYYVTENDISGLPEDIKIDYITNSNNTTTIYTKEVSPNTVVTLKNVHTGKKDFTLKVNLYRNVDTRQEFVGEYDLKKGQTKELDLPEKDDNGNTYEYYITRNGITGIPDDVVLDSFTTYDNNITINTRDAKGFSITTKWNGINPIGSIDVTLEKKSPVSLFANETEKTITLDESNNYSFSDPSAEAESYTVKDVKGSEEDSYNYELSGSDNAYTITVSKTGHASENVSIEVVNEKIIKGKFQIKKTNESGETLAGAVFTLKDSNNNTIDVTTKDNGLAKFEDLDPGRYTLEEKTAPNGYQEIDKSWIVIVGEDGNTTIKENIPGGVENIVDEIDNPRYTMLFVDGDDYLHDPQIASFTGDVFKEDQPGKYKLVLEGVGKSGSSETKPLFVKFDTTNFNVTLNGEKVESYSSDFNIKDGNKSKVIFDLELTNANFTGTRQLQPMSLLTFDGKEFEGKELDTYYSIITQTKENVDAPDLPLGEGNELTVVNKEKTTSFKLHKRDGLALEKPLEGVEFTLTKTDENGNPISGFEPIVKKTDSNGDIEFTDIVDGQYKLEETKSIDKYYDILIDFIVKVEDGKVSYTRKLKDGVDIKPEQARTDTTTEVGYDVEFLPKVLPEGEELPEYYLEIRSFGDDEVIKTIEGNGDDFNGFYKDNSQEINPKDYYVVFKFKNESDHDKWEMSYTKTANNRIQVILYLKDAYQELGENESIGVRNFPEQEGEGKIKIIKKDSEINDPQSSGDPKNTIPNVEFNVRGSNGYNKNFKTDSNGEINLDKLPNGVYKITEIKAPDGYIIDATPKEIIIGGKYEVPAVTGEEKDVTKKVHFNGDTEIHASNLDGDKKNPILVKTNDSEGFNITSHYTFDQGIKSGDYFYLDISNNANVWGIHPLKNIEDINLVGPLGLLAVGKPVINENGHYGIKYTFTKYLDNQYPDGASSIVSYFTEENVVKKDQINRGTIPNLPRDTVYNGPITFYTSLDNDDSEKDRKKTHDIQVYYTPTTYEGFKDPVNAVNRMERTDWEEGSYQNIIYVNRLQEPLYGATLQFGDDSIIPGGNPNNIKTIKNISLDQVKIYWADRDIDNSMPKSFGLNDAINNNLLIDYTEYFRENKLMSVDRNAKLTINFQDLLRAGNSYVVVVNGKFDKDLKQPLRARILLTATGYFNGYGWFEDTGPSGTFNKPYWNSSTTDGVITATFYNKKNEIEYTKMAGKLESNVPGDKEDPPKEGEITPPRGDSDGNTETNPPVAGESKLLAGAEFELRVKDSYGKFVTVPDSFRKSGEDGKFSWKALGPGDYQVWETKAPAGYKLPTDYVSSFTVTAGGDITNIKDNSLIIINEKQDVNIPQTGGRGTLLIIIIGVILMSKGIVLYERKKRRLEGNSVIKEGGQGE